MSYDCFMILKKLMTVNPSNRATLENLMKDQWLTLDVKVELRLYTEPPCENMDPWVNQKMMKMGFEWEHIKDSVTHRSYDRLMGMYLILSTTKQQVKLRAVKVRPFCCSDLNRPDLSTSILQTSQESRTRLPNPGQNRGPALSNPGRNRGPVFPNPGQN